MKAVAKKLQEIKMMIAAGGKARRAELKKMDAADSAWQRFQKQIRLTVEETEGAIKKEGHEF